MNLDMPLAYDGDDIYNECAVVSCKNKFGVLYHINVMCLLREQFYLA